MQNVKDMELYDRTMKGESRGKVRVLATIALKVQEGLTTSKHVGPGYLLVATNASLRLADPLPACVEEIAAADIAMISRNRMGAAEGFYWARRGYLAKAFSGIERILGGGLIGPLPDGDPATPAELFEWVGARLADKTFTAAEVARFAEHREVASALRTAAVETVSAWLHAKGALGRTEYFATAAATGILAGFSAKVLNGGVDAFLDALGATIAETKPEDLFGVVDRVKGAAS
jgi:hypothetical protein